MKILFACLHQINIPQNQIERITINKYTEDLKNYIFDTVDQISNEENKRRFWFSGEETPVTKIVDAYIKNSFEEVCKIAPLKLMAVEKGAQKKIKNLTEIQKGSLFQIVIETEKKVKRIFILKAENSSFLDDVEMIKRGGLPTSEKRKVYKAFVVKVNSDSEIEKVYVYDTHSKIANYWWSTFLELTEEKTNVYNTDRAFNSVIKKILNPIKNLSSVDHYYLHQATVQYFKTSSSFSLENFIDSVFTNYSPESLEVKIEDLIAKINELPEKFDFDTKFDIDTSFLHGVKINKKITLRENLELTIKGVVEDYQNIIIPEIGNDGRKYLKIQTDIGYDEFSK